MNDSVSQILEPFVRRGLFPSAESAVKEMANDYIARQIERYRALDQKLKAKYGMSHGQFTDYLRARAKRLADTPDYTLNRAVMSEEEDALEWKIAQEMQQSWLRLLAEVSA